MRKINHIVFLVLLQLFLVLLLHAQGLQQGVFFSFEVSSSEITNESGITTNRVLVVNNTDKERELELLLMIPAELKIIGKNKRTFSVKAFDSLFIPVRLMPKVEGDGGDNYLLKANLYSQDYQIATAIWDIHIKKEINWKAFVEENSIYYDYNSDTTMAFLTIKNSGNCDNFFKVHFSPSSGLRLQSTVANNTVKVAKNSSITIPLSVQRIDDEQHVSRRFQYSNDNVDKETLSIDIIPLSGGSTDFLKVDFLKVHNSVKAHESAYETLPFVMDLQFYDITGIAPNAVLSLFGQKEISKFEKLDYGLVFSGVMSKEYQEFYTSYHYISYTSQKTKVSFGHTSMPIESGVTMNGTGVVAKHQITKNHALEAGFVKAPKLFGPNSNRETWAIAYDYNRVKKDFKARTYYQSNVLKNKKVDQMIVGANTKWRISKNHHLSLFGNYSDDTHKAIPDSLFNLSGYQIYATYRGRFFKRLNLNGTFRQSSADYAGAKGVTAYNGRISWMFKQNSNIAGEYYSYTSKPNYWNNDRLIFSGLYSWLKRGKLSYNYRRKQAVFSLDAIYLDRFAQNLNVIWKGGEFSYTRVQQLFRWNASVKLGINTLPDYVIEDFLSSEIQLSIRYNRFKTHFVYYYGPRNINEVYEYIESSTLPKTFYASMSYDLWLGEKKNFLLNNNLNLKYRSFQNNLNISLRTEATYFIGNGFKANCYARFSVYNQGERVFEIQGVEYQNSSNTSGIFELGIGVTKELGIPISGKKNFDVTFIAYLDLNGNGSLDHGEPEVDNLLVSLTKEMDDISLFNGVSETEYQVLTNDKGMAILKNLEGGQYIVRSSMLHQINGWKEGQIEQILVDANREVYIPFCHHGLILGNIVLEKARFSRQDGVFSLANIRVAATDVNGKEYSCLTDREGNFSLNVPVSNYILTLNKVVFENGLTILNNDVKIYLSGEGGQSTVFHSFMVKEDSRVINVKGKNDTINVTLKVPEEVVVDSLQTIIMDTLDIVDTLEILPVLQDTISEKERIEEEPTEKPAEVATLPAIAISEYPNKGEVEYFSVLLVPQSTEALSKEYFKQFRGDVYRVEYDGLNYYMTGCFTKREKVDKALVKAEKKGFEQAIVVKIDGTSIEIVI